MIRGAHDGKQFVCTDYEEKDLDQVFESFFKIEWLIFIKRIEWIKRSYIFFISYISTFFAKIKQNVQKNMTENFSLKAPVRL